MHPIVQLLVEFGNFLLQNLGIILLVCLLVITCPMIAVIFRRIIFYIKIKRLCSKKKATLTFIHSPVKSIFRKYGDSDATINLGNQKYEIKFFPGDVYKKNIFLYGLEKADICKKHGFFLCSGTNVLGNADFTWNGKKRKTKIILDWKLNDAQKILLFQPTPIEITATFENEFRIIDGTEKIEHVNIYDANAFLNALARQL